MSLNGSFFHPDGMDYFKLRSTWDGNCVFCHNVKAQPNFDLKTRRYETEVAELGIACGACHGPAGQHASRAGSPFTRTLWRLGDSGPRDIINPSKLEPERSLMICGHCHGQRIPEPLERMQEIIDRGDPYNAGDDLAAFYRPVWRETKVGEYSFANRFWPNGSPRLTAYEYQGILRSACFNRGERHNRISCLSCHSMHEGDPKGQITEENRTNKPCLSCHQEYEPRSALVAHTGHRAGSGGSSCYNCHMPRVVYGIMAAHRTHDISVPDPQLTHSQQVPNACNQCHLDRSVNWAVTESKRLWPERFSQARTSPDSQFDLPEGPRSLMAGDALARALAAEALVGGGPGKPEAAWTAPWLVEALRDDYPIIRFFASAGLSRFFRGRPMPDYLDPTSSRTAADYYETLFEPAVRKNTSELARMLRSRRSNVDIEVGE
jgi:predicted CXXCH cytochrome family protein